MKFLNAFRRILLIIFLFALISVAVLAALPEGSVAPNVQRIAVFITILAGLLQIVPMVANMLNLTQVKSRPQRSRKRIRVFFILCNDCSTELKLAVLKQNQYQSLFEFELVEWGSWNERADAETRLSTLRTDSKLTFVNAFQSEMERYNERFGAKEAITNLAFTSLPFPQNYYTWNTKDKIGVVIGLKSLNHVLNTDAGELEKAVIRIMQRAVLYSIAIPNIRSHQETRGCLFDFTQQLANIRYSANSRYVCSNCEEIITRGKGREFFDEVHNWLQQSIS